jgi:uncharacterized membrane protein YfcA
MGLLEALLAAVVGLVGEFISTLASNGSAVTLHALEILGLPDNVANGTNRLSVVGSDSWVPSASIAEVSSTGERAVG